MLKLKNVVSNPQNAIYIINQIIYPLSQGCETKDVKIIKVSELIISLQYEN